MRTYRKPLLDIIATEVSKEILLQGSHDVEDFEHKDPIEVGGDDANELKKGLWDEE